MIIPGRFPLIYADPPWQYEMWGKETGYEKSPDAHYDCMSDEELLALKTDILFGTGEDAVLFMWAVWPKLPFALELMREWGFTYKTGGSWHKKTKHGKDAFGTGYIVRGSSEPWLIGTVGNPKILHNSQRNIIEDNILQEKIREHSRKPDCVYGMLEALFPGPYLELFARQQKDGWIAVGNEVSLFNETNMDKKS